MIALFDTRIAARLAAPGRCPLCQHSPGAAAEAPIPAHGVVVDESSRTVLIDGIDVDLTPAMFDVFAILASDPRRVFSRIEIGRQTVGGGWVSVHSRSVASTISRMRKRLRTQLGTDRYVHTVHSRGWTLLPRTGAAS